MTPEKMLIILETAILIANQPLSILALQNLFSEEERPTQSEVKTSLAQIAAQHETSGIELQEVASGYRFQAKAALSPWLSKLSPERPPRYSRAFLETLAIIAYKQPITRAEIEEIRGVTVSSTIIKTLTEREWVRVLGHRDMPGKPAIYGTTKLFLDYFNLKTMTDLPTLAEFKSFETQDTQMQIQLSFENSQLGPNDCEVIPGEREVFIEEDSSTTHHN